MDKIRQQVPATAINPAPKPGTKGDTKVSTPNKATDAQKPKAGSNK
jgi:hypothetical protein